jgi:UDP-N-acetylmuramate dehydrogenase
MLIERKLNIAKHTYFKVGGMVDYYAEVESEADLKKLSEKIENWNTIDKIVVGACSNILIADSGFRGLIIKNKFRGLKIEGRQVQIGAGEMIPKVVSEISKLGLSGMERIANIPGTVGGGIRGNVEAHGQSISDRLAFVKWYDFDHGTKMFSKLECEFEYRGSIFKHKLANKGMIIEGLFKFLKEDQNILIATMLEDKKRRKSAEPKGFSCGCFFKNIIINQDIYEKLTKFLGGRELQDRKIGDRFSAGILIDRCGLKGTKIGGAMVSDIHANFILNNNNATAKDIYDLYKFVQKRVFEKTGITLENEVQLVGDF